MIKEPFQKIKIYTIDDSSPSPIVIGRDFNSITITTQALNIPSEVTEDELQENPRDFIISENAVPSATMSGSVTLEAQPPLTFDRYPLPDNVINLSAPNFISTETPIRLVYVTLSGVSGSTHIAVSATCRT